MNIAEQIIEIMGGAKVVSEITGVHVSRVHRWKYPKARGGSDGFIPSKHQSEILRAAQDRGIDLAPRDFFEMRKAA